MSLDYLTGRKLDEIINQNNLIIEQNQLILSILSKEVKGTKVKKEKTNESENETGGYPIKVKMLAETLKTKNGDVFKVKPGMSVTAEVNVGKRRVIEFFLFPIIRYLDEGLKVR